MRRKLKYWRWRWRNRKAEKCNCGIPIAAPWSWCGMEPCKVMGPLLDGEGVVEQS